MDKIVTSTACERQDPLASNGVIGVDVGGTFTDVCAHDPQTGEVVYFKLPSTTGRSNEAIIEGILKICEREGKDPKNYRRVAHGTTIATNALIEGRGGRVALIVTEGFRDLLEIGRQTRPKIYDLQADHPPALVPRGRRFEVKERVTRGGKVLVALTNEEIERVVEQVASVNPDAVAVCLLFSFVAPEHEKRLGEALRKRLPEVPLSLSCEVRPEFREYERLSTTVLNAYLQPVMFDYLTKLEAGVEEVSKGAALGINQSSGGLISAERARAFPIRTALSGPAAGVAGAIQLAQQAGERNIITLDIGGTSSDVALISNFEVGTVHERWIEGYPARLSSVDIDAIGAGGGSIAWVDSDGLLKVGPQSAGAFPGPACYQRGGTQATVTDANLILGRLSGEGLLSGAMPLDVGAAENVMSDLAGRIRLKPKWAALGIIEIAVANMVRGIRAISVERGLDPRNYTLLAFGGAGPLMASAVARSIGIRKIMIPPHPGLLCAQGLIVADQLEHFVQTVRSPLVGDLSKAVDTALVKLDAEAVEWFDAQDIPASARTSAYSLDMRYVGQNFELSIPIDPTEKLEPEALTTRFNQAHDEAYGFHNEKARLEIVNARLAASGAHPNSIHASLPRTDDPAGAKPKRWRTAWFARDDGARTAVYNRENLLAGHIVNGPAIIDQNDTTTVIYPGDEASVDAHGNIIIKVNA
ncbi:MAG: hydantoinase/oxoprolinase family protein [Pseudomonadota bacterium]|nr:hydantoinase/oxoprolinase family protein [Pseudomonadota bacterium]